MFGVIPSFALVGPLALLAMLFPGVFAAVTYLWKQWRAFGITACTITTLSLVHWLINGWLPNTAWASERTLMSILLIVVDVGLVAAIVRNYYRPKRQQYAIIPSWKQIFRQFCIAALLIVVLFLIGQVFAWRLLIHNPMFGVTWITVGLFGRAMHSLGLRLDGSLGYRNLMSGEMVALLIMVLSGKCYLAILAANDPGTVTPFRNETHLIESQLIYESSDWTEVLSSIATNEQGLYFGVGRQSAFNHTGGIIALNHDGIQRWQFDAHGTIRPVFSTRRL